MENEELIILNTIPVSNDTCIPVEECIPVNEKPLIVDPGVPRDEHGRVLPGGKLALKTAEDKMMEENKELNDEQRLRMGEEIDRMLELMEKYRKKKLHGVEKKEFDSKQKLWMKILDKVHATKADWDVKVEKPLLIKRD